MADHDDHPNIDEQAPAADVDMNAVQSESEEEHKVGLLDAPVEMTGKRERVKVQRLPVAEPVKEAFEVKAGVGMKLGDMEKVCEELEKHKAADLVDMHRALFGVAGKQPQIKKNIRAFSGYPVGTDISKRRAFMNTRMLKDLKMIALILHVERGGTKEELIERLLTFLESPHGKSSNPATPKVKSAAADKPKTPKKQTPAKKTKSSTAKKTTAKHVDEPLSALMFYAVEFRNAVKEEDPSLPAASVMKVLRERFDALSATDRAAYEQQAEDDKARYAKELAAAKAAAAKAAESSEDDDEEDDDELDDLEEEDDEEFKPSSSSKKKVKPAVKKAKPATTKTPKKTPAIKKSTATVSDSEQEASDDDDEPLAKKVKTEPTNADLKKAVQKIIKSTSLDDLSKKKVRLAVAEQFPGVDVESKKDLLNGFIEDALATK